MIIRPLTSLCAAAVLLGLGAQSAAAQSDAVFNEALAKLEGTLNVAAEPVMNEGQLRGCTLVFDALHRDWAYRQGAPLKVSGNVGFIAIQGKLGASLKVVVHDIDVSSPSSATTPSPPSRAYLMDGFETNLSTLVEASPSDTPGALFSVFQLSPTFEMVLAGLQKNQLTVAFNSLDGSTDIRLPLQLDVVEVAATGERVRSDSMKADFSSCLRTLLTSSLPTD